MATGKTRGERRTGATIKHQTSLVGSSGSSSGKVSFHLSFSSAACLASTTDILCFCNINFLLNQTLLRATQRCQGENGGWGSNNEQQSSGLMLSEAFLSPSPASSRKRLINFLGNWKYIFRKLWLGINSLSYPSPHATSNDAARRQIYLPVDRVSWICFLIRFQTHRPTLLYESVLSGSSTKDIESQLIWFSLSPI